MLALLPKPEERLKTQQNSRGKAEAVRRAIPSAMVQ